LFLIKPFRKLLFLFCFLLCFVFLIQSLYDFFSDIQFRICKQYCWICFGISQYKLIALFFRMLSEVVGDSCINSIEFSGFILCQRIRSVLIQLSQLLLLTSQTLLGCLRSAALIVGAFCSASTNSL